MTDDPTFLQAIIDNPDEDGPRLSYADWLDNHGQTERAEFIRVQCEVAKPGTDRERRKQLFARSKALLETHGDEWLGRLREYASRETYLLELYFRRGFVENISISAQALLKHADAIFQAAPLNEVQITPTNAHKPWFQAPPDYLRQLAMCPYLSRLSALSLDLPPMDRWLRKLLDSPHLSKLEKLTLSGKEMGLASALALEPSRLLARLNDLTLHTGLDDAALAILLSSPSLRSLTALSLGNWLFSFSGSGIGVRGARALASCPYLTGLSKLDLRENGVEDAGLAALAHSSCLQHLTHLSLRKAGLTQTGVDALATSDHSRRLTFLDLSYNDIGDEGASLLAMSSGQELTILDLANCRIGDIGAQSIAESSGFSRLTFLRLESSSLGERRNTISDSGAMALAASPHLDGLELLSLIGNPIGEAGRQTLRERFGDRVVF